MSRNRLAISLCMAMAVCSVLVLMTNLSVGQEPEGPALLPAGPAYQRQVVAEPATTEPEETEPEEGTADETVEDETPELEPATIVVLPELTPGMAALRDRVRQTLAKFHKASLTTRENTATEVMQLCLAFGCNSELFHSGSPGGKVNGITCLCWNYPCAGFTPLGYADGHIAARIGYGLQQQPSQLLAVLALARAPVDYPVRVGDDERTIADLVEQEKLSCRSNTDLTQKLIGLAYFVKGDETWQNSLGEDWSVRRLVQEEAAKPIVGTGTQGTDRLMALSFALDRRKKRDEPLEEEYTKAAKYVQQFHEYAFAVQNSDGTWGPRLLDTKSTSRDQATQLRSTGHIVRWLAASLPEEQLEDPRLVRSIEQVNRLLGSTRYRKGIKSLRTQEIESVMHALHALMIYDQRYFTPRTPKQPEPEPAAQAAR